MIATLNDRIERDGYWTKTQEASGKTKEEVIKRLHNITFAISTGDQEAFDTLIMEAHGKQGLNFVRREFRDWLDPNYENPGLAFYEDKDRWMPVMNKMGKFDYTYNGRIHAYGQLETVINLLSDHPTTRQAYISVYDPSIDVERLGNGFQIPCVLGYHFQIDDTENGKELSMSVIMRSCDLTNCLRNDIWLSNALLKYVTHRVSITIPEIVSGEVSFTVTDLHKYPKITKDEEDEKIMGVL